jgi:hypothetical protein
MFFDNPNRARHGIGTFGLCIVVALVAVGLADVNGQVGIAPRNVSSYLPTPPPQFPALLSPPAYAGVWVGRVRETDSQSKIAGACRIYPIPQQGDVTANPDWNLTRWLHS